MSFPWPWCMNFGPNVRLRRGYTASTWQLIYDVTRGYAASCFCQNVLISAKTCWLSESGDTSCYYNVHSIYSRLLARTLVINVTTFSDGWQPLMINVATSPTPFLMAHLSSGNVVFMIDGTPVTRRFWLMAHLSSKLCLPLKWLIMPALMKVPSNIW